MKVQLTVSAEQLALLYKTITYSAVYDRLLKKDEPRWVDLQRTIQEAYDELNNHIPHRASYKII